MQPFLLPMLTLVLVCLAAPISKSSGADSSGPMRVYVSVGGENRIAVLRLDGKTGKLTPQSNTQLGGAPGSLAFHPNGKFLYAAVRSNKAVAALGVDDHGDLQLLSMTPAVDNPVYVKVDHTGRHLLTAYYGAGKAAVYPIRPDGTVAPEASHVVETGKNPHSILIDATNRWVFVPCTGADRVLQFAFHADRGQLAPIDPPLVETEPGAGPRHFTFSPDRRWVFVVNEKNSSLTSYRLHKAAGRLEPIMSLSTLPQDFQGRNTCADIHVTPSGKFVYGSNRGHDSLAGYRVDAKTGRIESLGQFATEQTPREFDIDPSGTYLIAAGQGSGKLATYRIDAKSGHLQPLAVDLIGKSPAWVLITRAGGNK